jgi:tRNA(Ile2) C34 agmatinyltransferase TiaS
MKGPKGRLHREIRRTWECPVCGRHEKTGGQVVNQRCEDCARAQPPRDVWMRLVEDATRRPVTKPANPSSSPPESQ